MTPPRFADRLLTWLVAPHLREEVLGDRHERFLRQVEQLGEARARRRYWRDLLAYLRPAFLKRQPDAYSNPTNTDMLRNYLKITIRTLIRNKLYTVLNVAGLTFGITCFLLIGLYLFDELTFDQQHGKTNRIYRIVEHRKTKTEEFNVAAASYTLAEEAKRQIAEIENTARMNRAGRADLINPETQAKFQETVAFADQSLLEIFDFEVVDGDSKTALKEPNSIIIVEELAQRLFKSTKVAGRTLKFSFTDTPLKVTAVLKTHPRNSSFDFNSMISLNSQQGRSQADWYSNEFMVFALLKGNTTAETVAKKITALLYANFKPEIGTSVAFSLQPLADIHLYSENIIDAARNSNVEAMGQGMLLFVKVFAVVAIFVLLIACINYMNLATARASNRAKEIGVRKASGAFRSQLVWQFLVESLLVTLLSFILAVILVNLLQPAFNEFTGKQLSLNLQTDYRIWLYTILVLLVTGFVSGSYPALLLSNFKPVVLLKSLKIQSKSNLSLRKGLVVFQFTVSVVIMIATIVLFLQIRYTSNKDLGFRKDLLVVVDINSEKARTEADAMKTELARLSDVKNVSVTSRVPGEWKQIRMVKIKSQGSTEDYKISYLIGVDVNFAKTFEVRILQGRNFTSPADSSAVLLNETAAKALNISQPSGQLVEIPSWSFGGDFTPLNESNQPFRARVIGIVKDFHFQSLREKISPMVLAYQNNPVQQIDYYTARIEGGNIPATLKRMEAAMATIDPTHTFEYHFLDEQLARFYLEDQRRQTLLIWVALSTIFIACLGLFGLATYAAEQRVKEIGVRKVLGASVLNLTALLSKDFLKLVLIANGIAFPVAWWATSQWLGEFAYHINVEWWIFVAAGALAIAIALLTISYQAIKAALVNPVKSLRSE
ncbi:ABC transporter permease [Larkinella bovis]|uniref:ABC transporter permease n=1 Tax=Larkinella bovis TaxID=683041 RepID=A0ABW0IDE2_9BACT